MSPQPNRRILLVDDTPDIHQTFRRLLARRESKCDGLEEAIFGLPQKRIPEFELHSVFQGQEAVARVQDSAATGNPFAMAFVDMRMPPGWDGVDTIERLWSVDPDLQVVICTAYSDHSWERILERLDPGDRLLILKKPFDPIEVCQLAMTLTAKWNMRTEARARMQGLEQAVAERTVELRQVNEALRRELADRQRKDERIRHLAFHDHLTGLPNQTLLIEQLNDTIALARRDSESFALLFIDLDRFKAINDSYGHDVGNVLLKEISRRLRGCLRRSDVVARIGGDEFVVLLKRTAKPEGYVGLAKKIIARLSQPARIAGKDVQVGASIGIAGFPDDGTDVFELMKHADAAMYAAKSSGRGTFRFFQTAMSERVERRLRLEMDLRTAVRDDELELRYQPKVSLVTGDPVGVEALIRWRHRRHGLLPPAEFLPPAEEIGLAGQVGDWVFQEVFRQSRVWSNRGMEDVHVAVNISVEQVQRSDLIETITALADRHGFPLDRLEIELTESGIMADPEAVSAILGQLRELGIRIAIDDFGTGYSSLAYLRKLPIDVLKIDKSFVMSADGTPSDAEIVKTIIGLGRTLNLTVVAEGVETAEQADFLRSCGCTVAQGYLFARPLTSDQLEIWLRERSQMTAPQRAS